ncbi:MAG: flippase [Planctomycetes bacterium]|nr:flippase [Planctomycetota bacterium]
MATESDGRVGRSFLALASGDGLARVIAFAAGVYVARTLSKEAFGVVTLSTGLLLYFTNIVECGIDLVGVRQVAHDEPSMRRLAPALVGTRLALALLLALGIAAFSRAFLPEPEATVFSVYGISLIATALSTRWIHLGLERTRRVATARTLGECLYLAGVLLLVHRFQDLALVPVAQLAGDALAAVILWISIRGLGWRPEPRFAFSEARPVLSRSWPLVANVLLGLTIYNSDLIFLRIFQGRGDVGLYSAAYQLISFLINMAAAYSLSLLPVLTRARPETGERGTLYARAFGQTFSVALPIAVGGALVAPQIVSTVFGPEYAASTGALMILLGTIPFTMSKEVDLIALVVAGREATVMRMTAAAVVVNLALNLWLIPRYGMIGAAWSTLATEAARALFARFCARAAGYPSPGPSGAARALVAAAAMGAALWFLPGLVLPAAVGLGAVVYAVSLTAVGGLALRRGGWPTLRG